MSTLLLFLALWIGQGRAHIEWEQPPNIKVTCLSKGSVLIHCWTDAPAGRYVVDVGGPLTDGAERPERGALFQLWQDGVISSATIRGRVYVPVVEQ